MKLIHYYHIYCGGGVQWQLIMNQHMMALSNYGLIDKLDEIRVGIVGPPEQRKAVKEILDNSLIKDKVKVVVTRTNAWEQATLTEMYKASQDEDAAYLYAHTKGSSDPSLINQLWCRSMIFFNVVAWERCLVHLGQGGLLPSVCPGNDNLYLVFYQRIVKYFLDCLALFGWTNDADPNLIQPFYQAVVAQGHQVLVHDELPLAAASAVDVVVVDEFHREAIAKSKTNNKANLPKIKSKSRKDSRFMGVKLHHQVLA